MATLVYVLILSIYFLKTDAARILVASPIPSQSHQVAFYPIIQELLRRGHNVTFITTDPVFRDKTPPDNLKEIDIGKISYELWTKDLSLGEELTIKKIPNIFEKQMMDDTVPSVLKKVNEFDLVIVDAWIRPLMLLSHIYKVPVIKLSPSGFSLDNADHFGVPNHPVIYPDFMHQKAYNFSFLETISELYKRYSIMKALDANEVEEDEVLRRLYGPDVPSLREVNTNADMLMLNINHFWDRNRPLPRNVLYVGRDYEKQVMKLPEDINTFLESYGGAIFINFGNNIPSSRLPAANVEMFLRVFSKLPFKVLWQSDIEKIDGPDNVIIRKWFPQLDILRHPKTKLIITQGDLQTVEDVIDAAIPLIGIPLLADQRLNVEHIVHYGMGVSLDIETIDEEQFKNSITKVIEDPSYKTNAIRFRSIIHDTRMSSLDRAVLWIEYILKHSNLSHLKSPASDLSWSEYFELELIAIVLCTCIGVLSSFWLIIKLIVKKFEDIIARQAKMNFIIIER